MGVKTTINNKGVFSETVPGNDKLVIDLKQTKAVRNKLTITPASATGTVTHQEPVTLYRPASQGVTASLPTIGSSNVGTEFLALNDESGNPVLLSASNAFGTGSWTKENSTALGVVQAIAVSGSSGYYWHLLIDD